LFYEKYMSALHASQPRTSMFEFEGEKNKRSNRLDNGHFNLKRFHLKAKR